MKTRQRFWAAGGRGLREPVPRPHGQGEGPPSARIGLHARRTGRTRGAGNGRCSSPTLLRLHTKAPVVHPLWGKGGRVSALRGRARRETPSLTRQLPLSPTDLLPSPRSSLGGWLRRFAAGQPEGTGSQPVLSSVLMAAGGRDREHIGALCPFVRLVPGARGDTTGDRRQPDPVWQSASISLLPRPLPPPLFSSLWRFSWREASPKCPALPTPPRRDHRHWRPHTCMPRASLSGPKPTLGRSRPVMTRNRCAVSAP